MKLNFWQWLGVVLLVVGLALYALKKSRPAEQNTAPETNTPPPAATAPATTTPATAPR